MMAAPLDFEVLGDAAPAVSDASASPGPGFEVLGDIEDGQFKPKAQPNAVVRGLAEGINQVGPGTLGSIVEMMAIDNPDPGHAKRMWDWAQDIKKWGGSLSGPEYKAKAKRLQDITGASDLGTWIGETMGQGFVSMAPPLIGGGVGTVAAGPVGGFVGMTAPSYALNSSDIYESLKQEGLSPKAAKDLAKIVAVPVTGLDVLPTERILGNLTGNARNDAIKGIAKRLVNAAKEAAVTGGMEFTTEGAQQAIQEMAGALSTGKDPLEAKRWWKVLSSAIGGGLVGAPMGAGSGLMARGETEPPPSPPPGGEAPQQPPETGQQPPGAQPGPPPPQSPPGGGPTPQQPPTTPAGGFEVVGDVPTPDDIAAATETIESGGKPNAKSATSSATGPHGFIDGTWLDLMSRYRPDLTKGKSRSEILAMRTDRDTSTEMSKHYADENARVLSNAGIEPNPQNTYLSHFLGAGGARKVLLARPGTPVDQLLKPDAIKANPGILTDAQGNPRTAGFVVRTAAGKMRAALASHGITMPGETPDAAAKAMVEDAPSLQETEGMGPDPIWFAMASGLIPPSPEFNAEGLYAPKAAPAAAPEPETPAPASEPKPTAQEEKPSAVSGRVPASDAKPGPGVSQPTVGERPTAKPSGPEVPGGTSLVAGSDLGGSEKQRREPARSEPDAGSGGSDQKPAIQLPDLTETEQAAPDAGQAPEASTPVAASPPPAGTAPAQPAAAPAKPQPTLKPPKPEVTNDDIERMFDDAVGDAFPGQKEASAPAAPKATAPAAEETPQPAPNEEALAVDDGERIWKEELTHAGRMAAVLRHQPDYGERGAAQVAKTSWKHIPEGMKPSLLKAAREISKENQASVAPPAQPKTETPAAPAAAETPQEAQKPAPAPERTTANESSPSADEGTAAPQPKSERIISEEAYKAAKARLRRKLSGGQLSAGIDPEILTDGAILAAYHVENGVSDFVAWSRKMIADLGDEIRPFLKGLYNFARDYPGLDTAGFTTFEDMAKVDVGTIHGDEDVTGSGDSVEQGSGGAEPPGDGLGEKSVPASTGGSRRSGGGGGGTSKGGRNRKRNAGGSLSGTDAAPMGEPGNSSLQPEVPDDDATSDRDIGGSDQDSEGGLPFDENSGESATEVADAAAALDFSARKKAQAAANAKNVVPADSGNIAETLPLLYPEQHEDVLKAETRFADGPLPGFMITNGTGTGKTFSGMGVIARMARIGKKNILLVSPRPVTSAWKDTGKLFGVNISDIKSIKDAGRGVVITTPENLAQNSYLADREWDLVVVDEAHRLSAQKEGAVTSALETFRAITNHPRGGYRYAEMVLRDLVAKIDAEKKRSGKSGSALLDRLRQEFTDKEKGVMARERSTPKVLMLSATPFAYVENVPYAEGYLFSYPPEPASRGYNSPSAEQLFFIENFGYRMRTGKLTKPDAGVDTDIMERNFIERLRREGSLSGRILTTAYDYDRKFVVVDDVPGKIIDDAMDFLQNAENGRFRPLYDIVNDGFDYLTRRRLLEAMKASYVTDTIKQHLDLGRKVVVFHDYIDGGGQSPFDVLRNIPKEKTVKTKDGDIVLADLADDFFSKMPAANELHFGYLSPPASALKQSFGDRAAVFNGRIPTKTRDQIVKNFQDDNSGIDVVIVQSLAGGTGVSLHDLTGKKQRVILNIGLPDRPVTAIQQEGRIRRDGMQSNAIVRYVTTGTNWERWTFAGSMAQRSGTAENLAMGEMARDLRQAYIEAYQDADYYTPEPGEGVGGKARDAASVRIITPWDRALSAYWAQQKNTKRRQGREGVDYFATPEPLGFKLVEWADIHASDDVLEPSAGHGAIARWFPEETRRTLVEPSWELASKAALSSPGATVVNSTFEDLNVVRKYDAIVMNPPFGAGGSTAIAHLGKAAGHLRNGGRVVAIIPIGPAADAKFEKFYENVQDVYLVAEIELPAVTFERAGTAVRTKVVILEKQTHPDDKAKLPSVRRDLSNAETIRDLFSRLESMSIPPRTEATVKEPKTLDVSDGAQTVVAGGIELQIKQDGDQRLAKLLQRVGGNVFARVAGAARAVGGDWNRNRRLFVFPDDVAVNAFVDRLSAPDPDQQPSAVAIAPEVKFQLAETTHALKGVKLYVASNEERVSREKYDAMVAAAKRHDGYYSAYNKRGAIPGFQFESEETRAAFVMEVNKGGALAPQSAETEKKASRFTPSAEPQIDPAIRERIVKRIKAIAKQIAPLANVDVFDQIPGAADVGGFYDPATGMIEVALKIGDPDVAVRHETVHALRAAGLFTDAEWKALTRHAEETGMLARVNDIEGYADLTDEGKLEEAVAQQFAENMAGAPLKAPVGPLRAAFNKVMTFFKRLAAALRGMGFKTIDDIHQDIESGRVGARETYPASGEKALDTAAALSTATARAVYVMQDQEGALRLDLDAKRNPGESLIATVFGDEVQLAHDRIFDEYVKKGVPEADLWKYGVERLRALARQHEASMQPKYSRFKMDEQSERIAEKTFGTTDRSLKERLMDWGHEYLSNGGRKLIQQAVDRYRTWYDYERDENGTLLDASRSAYKQLRMAGRATPDAAYHIVYRGPMEVKRDKNGGIFWGGKEGWTDGGIRDIVEPLAQRGLLKMWELQRVVTRAVRLDTEGREKLLRAVADSENMTVPELSRFINGKVAAMNDEQRAMMREADRKWEKFNAAMLDFAEDAGLISKADRALYENSDYIPFFRLHEMGDDIEALLPHAGGANSQHLRSGIKRLKGGEAKINAIVENMISNATSLASRSIANIAKGQALRAAESWGAAKHLTVTDMMRSRNVKLPTVVAALRKFGWDVDLVPKNYRNHVVEMWLKEFPDAADVVSIMRDGQPEYYRLADPDLMAGLVQVRIEQLNDIVRMLQPLKRLLTRGVTAMPPFMYRNFVRDTMATWMMTGLAPGMKTIRAMISTARRDETYWKIMGMGGTGGGFYSSEAGDMRRRLDNVNRGAGRQSKALEVISTPWEYLTRLGEISELTNRRAVYDWVIENGGTEAEAAYYAVDLLDFGLTGASHTVRSFRAVVAFLGARINGLYRMYRAFEDPTSSPLSRGAQQRMVAGMVMGVVLRGLAVAGFSVALEALMGDDDDYQDMPNWKKDAYWVLPGGYLFPKPFEFGFLFSTIPQRLYRLAARKDKPSDFGESMINGLLNTLAFNPVATGLVPIVEQLAGKQFFPWGAPVVPRAVEDLLPEYQYMPYTGETARQIGALAGISPVRFEKLIRGYTGDLGMYALAATDGLLRAALDKPVPPASAIEFGETYGVLEPLEKAVNGIWASMHERQPARSTKAMEEFYALRSEIQSLSNSFNAMKKSKNFDEARDLRDQHREELALESQLNSASDRLSSIRRREKEIWESRDSAVTKREKLDNLQQQRNDLAQEFMRRPAVLRVIEGIQAAK